MDIEFETLEELKEHMNGGFDKTTILDANNVPWILRLFQGPKDQMVLAANTIEVEEEVQNARLWVLDLNLEDISHYEKLPAFPASLLANR